MMRHESPGAGSTNPAAAPNVKQEQVSAGPAFPVGMRVLLVDDDPLTLKVVGEMLRRCNYEGEHRGMGFSCLAPHRFRQSIY